MGNFSLEVVSTQSKIDVNRRMNMEIQKWEYRLWRGQATSVHNETSKPTDSSGYGAVMDDTFDEWGSYGWELVSVVPCGPEERELIFKRPNKAPYFEPLDIDKEPPSFRPASSSN